MTSPHLPPAIPYRDLWRILKRARHWIMFSALVCGCSALLFSLAKPTWYRSHAIFREKMNSGQKSLMQSDGLLSSLVAGGASSTSQQDFYSLMRSRRVLEPAIEEAGLQVRLRPLLSPTRFLLHLTDHLRLEARYWMELFDPDTPFEPFFSHSLRAKHVHYEGDSTLWYTLTFISNNAYQLHDLTGNLLGSGTLEKPFTNPLFTVTFLADPAADLAGTHFRIKLVSIQKAVEKCQSHLTIRSVKEREKLFQLTFYHPNRTVVSHFLNALMLSYQKYHDEEATRLQRKERALWEETHILALRDLEAGMRNYAHAGRSLIATTGFLDPEKQLGFLLAAQQRLSTRQEQLVQEEARCAQLLTLPLHSPMTLALPSQQMPSEFRTMVQAYLQDDAQRKLLLETLKEQKQQELEYTEIALEIPTVPAGMDLPTAQAKSALLQHTEQEIETKVTQHQLFLSQLDDPEFPLSALVEALEDPTSREMILLARTLQAKLHDQENYLERDRLHIQHALNIQRKDAVEHFTQRLASLKQQNQEIKRQINAIRRHMLALLTERVRLHEKEIKAALNAMLSSFAQEKEQLAREMVILQESLTELPLLWATQQMQQASLHLQKAILEERSKWMESHEAMRMHDLLASGPVDMATPPLFPSYPGVLLYTLLGLLFGALPVSIYALTRARTDGLPVSSELLQLMGQKVIGTLSTCIACVTQHRDRDTLRYLACEILRAQEKQESTYWLLFLEKNMDKEISQMLVQLLEAEGKKASVEIGLGLGNEDEEPEALIQLMQRIQCSKSITNPVNIHILLTHIPPTSGRAMQLIRHVHGVAVFLTEETATTKELAPLWSAIDTKPCLFLFVPILGPKKTEKSLKAWHMLKDCIMNSSLCRRISLHNPRSDEGM